MVGEGREGKETGGRPWNGSSLTRERMMLGYQTLDEQKYTHSLIRVGFSFNVRIKDGLLVPGVNKN